MAPTFGPFGDFVLNIGTLVFAVAAVIELAFLIHYVRVAPAFKSWIGIMFVLRSSSFLLAGVAILLGRLWGPTYAGRPYVTFGLYVLVLVSACTTYGTFLYERYHPTKPQRTLPNAPGSFARRAMGLLGMKSTRRQAAERTDTGPIPTMKDA